MRNVIQLLWMVHWDTLTLGDEEGGSRGVTMNVLKIGCHQNRLRFEEGPWCSQTLHNNQEGMGRDRYLHHEGRCECENANAMSRVNLSHLCMYPVMNQTCLMQRGSRE